jgi:hypothetical protein
MRVEESGTNFVEWKNGRMRSVFGCEHVFDNRGQHRERCIQPNTQKRKMFYD